MNEPLRRTWYVSRRVDAPAVVVIHALESLLADGPLTVGADGTTLAVDLDDGRLTGRPDRPTFGVAGRGRLGVRGRFGARVAVDLEVEAWSGTECELALRPAGRRLPSDPVRYGEAAAIALERFRDVVVRMLAAPAVSEVAEPLRRAS